ncbi:uncharacterized protein TRAVEDRAFT_111741 [Trametes versicolor FP-101664 SS1]|uniref:uncharacterized protein n=1 Tax=Trametes versicolor (strain FP-101664) TaxID=717944 RepID=UPI0004621C12|nr:uncharacterized protein TRAVEDRAFT_111741 [Trametes versicolor FP-101664 SS1]EIW63925.1 hypothetical protein TRAVEDRAFT_111741 [Trametes versicolor FP-101664 SS1]
MLPDPLFDVLRAYATLQSPKTIMRISVPFGVLHGFLLNHILLNPHLREFPPSKRYQVSFWKWAIDWLEQLASDEARYILTLELLDEIDERIYTHHIDLIQELSAYVRSLGADAPPPSYMTYLWPAGTAPIRPVYSGYASATLLESQTTIEGGTTGLRTWSASLVLAQYLLSNTELIRGRNTLELGCGAGLLGIVAASVQLAGSTDWPSLWLTDVNEIVLQRCEHNLKLQCNQSHEHPNLHIRTLDWSDAADTKRCSSVHAVFDEAQPEIILGADVGYDPSIIPPLLDILVLALSSPSNGYKREAYIAITQRNEDTLAGFIRQAEERLSVEIVASMLAADNIFTAAAELGHAASAHTVKIFRLQSKS